MERKWFTDLHKRYGSFKLPSRALLTLIFETAVFIAYVSATAFESKSHQQNMHLQVNGYFSFGHYFGIPTETFPSISDLLLFANRNKLSKIYHDINMIDESLGIRAKPCNSKRSHCLFLLLLILEVFFEFRTEGYIMLVTPTVYIYYVLIFLKWLVVWEFAERFSVIRFYYGQLSEHLDILRVEKEKLVECHEVLGTCCSRLWECYALQMTVFVVYSFLYCVFSIYLVVDSYSRSGTMTTYHNVYLFWTMLYCSFIWFIVYSCAETKKMAKKFDKKLSQQIMNDVTNKLINNKRIMQHFKVKFKDFSGMGFFNFDYPLLFSMVSSATTYIVILVQFSGR
ncbi:Gustatory receptor 147f, partial [Halyomorpha halys]